MLAPYIKNYTAVFNELLNIPKLVLSPLPRYLTMGCCNDPEHAPNRAKSDFRRKVISGADRLRKAIRDQHLANGVRNFKVVNPFWLLAGEKTTDAALQSTVDQLWGEDPVHVSEEGYIRLWEALEKAARSLIDSNGSRSKITQQN